MSNINDVIARAQAAASAAAEGQATPGTAVATTAPQGGAVAVHAPAAKLTMETLAVGSINVDQWLKVKQFGLLIGDNGGLIETMKVSIKMVDGQGFLPKVCIKAGNPAQYWSSYDGATCPGVGSWEQACQKARSIDPKAREYRSVDLPMTLLEPAKDVKGNEIAKAGTILGHSTATTNWANWESFYREVATAGLIGQEVEVQLGFEPKKNKNGQEWGVVTFKLIGPLEQDGE